ncbi:NeuD/PglB/VioB family sugar acetyltransferase [Epilithonimonas caeni]|uniref:NeuD/PglB/VioB family sugar acetyltransferase n=1 Tax=Epilithonimonas caeni TaxID=365343 RepID=UPI00042A00C0|nr:NeuD/PglB/VioB family sugar acetyltransferase [Epilithonimonas caeni]
MKENCIIVGAGTYGQVYAEYLKDEYSILGFIDDDQTLHNVEVNGIKVLGDFDFLLNNIDISTNVFIPIGNNKVRVQLLQKTIEKGFRIPNFIHKTAKIHPSVEIGKGVYILPGTQIMPLTQIKDFVLISMGVNIAHHNIIDQGCFFSQGSNIGANIYFKSEVFCGIASTIMTGVKEVGKNSLIGAGAVVIRDVPDFAVVVGNPGKIIKYNEPK